MGLGDDDAPLLERGLLSERGDVLLTELQRD
jgi:hypothetical protein